MVKNLLILSILSLCFVSCNQKRLGYSSKAISNPSQTPPVVTAPDTVTVSTPAKSNSSPSTSPSPVFSPSPVSVPVSTTSIVSNPVTSPAPAVVVTPPVVITPQVVTPPVVSTPVVVEPTWLVDPNSISAQEKLASFSSPATWNNWEFSYDGKGTPADTSMPYAFWMDNPVDDDLGDDPRGRGICRYRFNSPSEGFLTVDRILDPDLRDCPSPVPGFTGNIWRRDEYLSFAAGATIEVKVQIPDRKDQRQHDAFFIQYVDDQGSVAVYLSPYCAKIGPLFRPDGNPARHGCVDSMGLKAKSIDATQMAVYRLVKKPGSHSADLYMNGALILSGAGNTYNNAVSTEYEYPYILVGDNVADHSTPTSTEVTSTSYTLDYLRYSRGSFPGSLIPIPPTDASGPYRVRQKPTLPLVRGDSQSLTEGWNFDSQLPHIVPTTAAPYTEHFSGDGLSRFKIGELDTGDQFTVKANPTSGKGAVWIDSSDSGSYTKFKVPGISGTGAWTVEIRTKVAENSDSRAFGFNWWDQLGSVTLLLSSDRVELVLGHKLIGHSLPIVVKKGVFHKYRLVRQASSLYVSLYVDDQLAIPFFKLSGSQMNGTSYGPQQNRIWFGWTGHAMANEWKNGYPVNKLVQNLWIDYIHWKGEALAP